MVSAVDPLGHTGPRESATAKNVDQSGVLTGLDQLGLGANPRQVFEPEVRDGSGLIIAPGPGDSAGTPTLWSALNLPNS